jgi:hypothetical protein
MGVWYATVEDVRGALETAESRRSDTQIRRALESGSRSVEGQLRRVFYPELATRYKDWPNYQYADTWRLWLDKDELISVSTLAIAGTATTAYLLRPDTGPPFTRIEMSLATSSSFSSGSSHQRSIAITGVFGHSAPEEAAGELAEALDASETGVDVTDSATLGTGSVIRVDNERMIVTRLSMLDTTQDLQTPMTESLANTTVAVSDGTKFFEDETILLDSERMRIVDIAGNNLTVKRAVDGSVLAAHTGSSIFAPRTLTVTRGALGTTAATHSLAAPVLRLAPPGLVVELTVAEALNTLQQEQSGYARVVGEGENAIEVRGQGLSQIRADALIALGRRARTRAV